MTQVENMIKKILRTSLGRAAVYTFGHILIAMFVVKGITGSDWVEAGTVALVEPAINGVWYYILDKMITKYAHI
jgi:uncharacterized membrane protein